MIKAQSLTVALGGVWYGSYGVAHCPACQPEARAGQAALALNNGGTGGKLLLHCHKSGCAFGRILSAADVGTLQEPGSVPADQQLRNEAAALRLMKREKRARTLWSAATPIGGTPAETYLRSRNITCDLPETLRYYPNCAHPSGSAFPAMIARVDRAEGFAVHRTYLRADGLGKAQTYPQKAMLGPVKGGAVNLAGVPQPIVVAEGIETGLSLLSGLLPGPATVLAALSTSGMRSLQLPAAVGDLLIAADGDKEGGKAAGSLASRARSLGWREIMSAPEARDWNDVLALKGGAA